MSLASIDNKTQNFCIFPVDFHRWLCLLCFPELNFFSFLQGDNHQVRTTVWYLHYLSHVTLHTNINPAHLFQRKKRTSALPLETPHLPHTVSYTYSHMCNWILVRLSVTCPTTCWQIVPVALNVIPAVDFCLKLFQRHVMHDGCLPTWTARRVDFFRAVKREFGHELCPCRHRSCWPNKCLME